MITKLGETIEESDLNFIFNLFSSPEEENSRYDLFILKALLVALKRKKDSNNIIVYETGYAYIDMIDLLNTGNQYSRIVLRHRDLVIHFQNENIHGFKSKK